MKKSTSLVKKTVVVDGKQIHYTVAGSGPPLILLHGLSASSVWWEKNVKTLSTTHLVYLIDLPGHGMMRRHGTEFSLKNSAEWLYRFTAALDLPRVSVIGHSMGGYIALSFAATHPESVLKLILVAPIGYETQKALLSYILPVFKYIFYTNTRFYPILLFDALRAGPKTILRLASELVSQDMQGEASRVQAPTLLIWGARDMLVSHENGLLLQKAIAHSDLIVFKRAGHLPMFDQPHDFTAAVLKFLSR